MFHRMKVVFQIKIGCTNSIMDEIGKLKFDAIHIFMFKSMITILKLKFDSTDSTQFAFIAFPSMKQNN